MAARPGTLYGVGLGPGDPELVTLKAQRVLRSCPVTAFFRKRGRPGHARTIARGLLREDVIEQAFDYPVTTEIPFADEAYAGAMHAFYGEAARMLRSHLDDGRDVALLCAGDPFLYGSFLHLYDRLRAAYPITVIPGVTAMSGCWTAAGAPIACGGDVLAVLPGTLGKPELTDRLRTSEAAVIIKVGGNVNKVKAALAAVGRLGEAIYVERATMEGERVLPLAEFEEETAPYFSIILVPGARGLRSR